MEEGTGKRRRSADERLRDAIRGFDERLRDAIRDLDKRMDEFADWVRKTEAELRDRTGPDASALRQKLAEARLRLHELKTASEGGWEEVKSGAQRICVDVRAAWDRQRETRSDHPPGGSASASDTADPSG
ncbi:MAG: hypothetical protein OYK82_01730 [Gammaproteobacteria bacterium]|nr:hypothetical protein [Gammaproteobacteria bacterium]